MRNASNEISGAVGAFLDITDRRNAEADLRSSRAELRALAARVESLREEERARISREIHDDLGQKLTALKMDLVWTVRKLSDIESSPIAKDLADRLTGDNDIVKELLIAVQKIATDLRPSVLDKLGLATALRFEAARFLERTGVPCTVRVTPADLSLSPHVATALFRIFQECLTNVARHAQASAVDAELKLNSGWLKLQVHDNGRGITKVATTDPSSLGLLGMRERAALLGGECIVRRGRAGGTTVKVLVPSPPRGAA